MVLVRPISRASAPFSVDHPKLGPLAELAGTWLGNGFNLIARPDFRIKSHSFLRSMALLRIWSSLILAEASPIVVPSRTSLHGLQYLQKNS